jgi:hypothetical protein
MAWADTAVVRPLGKASPKAEANPEAAARGSWISRALKCLLAMLLLPACAAFAQTWYERFNGFEGQALGAWFLGGAGVFAFAAVLLWRPVVLYVLAHELTHALAALACLSPVSRFRAGASGGEVTVQHPNTLIRLAPYCVPLYALLIGGAWIAAETWWRPLDQYRPVLAAALGFALAFHLGFTGWSLRHNQPDVKPDGYIFSVVMVFLANLLAVTALLGLALTGTPAGAWEALSGVACEGFEKSLEYYRWIGLHFQHP